MPHINYMARLASWWYYGSPAMPRPTHSG